MLKKILHFQVNAVLTDDFNEKEMFNIVLVSMFNSDDSGLL